ncbi:MAG TPA: hypothetical protein VKF14_06590 [Candidatus Dormibacteraeota bacterium]|nr:hypothetical protein [Candidatus Dormibacteraeota bacterium]
MSNSYSTLPTRRSRISRDFARGVVGHYRLVRDIGEVLIVNPA